MLTIGRTLHFVLNNGECRPAVIVRVWPDEFGANVPGYNVLVFYDGNNDRSEVSGPNDWVQWKTSIQVSDSFKVTRTLHDPRECEKLFVPSVSVPNLDKKEN